MTAIIPSLMLGIEKQSADVRALFNIQIVNMIICE